MCVYINRSRNFPGHDTSLLKTFWKNISNINPPWTSISRLELDVSDYQEISPRKVSTDL